MNFWAIYRPNDLCSLLLAPVQSLSPQCMAHVLVRQRVEPVSMTSLIDCLRICQLDKSHVVMQQRYSMREALATVLPCTMRPVWLMCQSRLMRSLVICESWPQAHPSNAYDERSLRLFAQGLRDAGYRDRAATVYYSLLHVSDVHLWLSVSYGPRS